MWGETDIFRCRKNRNCQVVEDCRNERRAGLSLLVLGAKMGK